MVVVAALEAEEAGEAEQAEQILTAGPADGVAIARAALQNPHWPAAVASRLCVAPQENPRAKQLWRAFS